MTEHRDRSARRAGGGRVEGTAAARSGWRLHRCSSTFGRSFGPRPPRTPSPLHPWRWHQSLPRRASHACTSDDEPLCGGDGSPGRGRRCRAGVRRGVRCARSLDGSMEAFSLSAQTSGLGLRAVSCGDNWLNSTVRASCDMSEQLS
eukprot:86915-Chlamydomonas_euryale.AAC.4